MTDKQRKGELSMSEKNSKHDGMIRGFYHLSESWYGEANLKRTCANDMVDSVAIGFYEDNGESGTTGEFAVTWNMLGNKLVPFLKVYDDAWDALAFFSDVLAEMAKLDDKNTSPQEFCEMLKRQGIKDLTKRGKKL